ncbi:unnamed protein product [Symbiodinium sp. CCMP2592]|nr:unnamed protein product [Symbiodinium sp. CCMP2592]
MHHDWNTGDAVGNAYESEQGPRAGPASTGRRSSWSASTSDPWHNGEPDPWQQRDDGLLTRWNDGHGGGRWPHSAEASSWDNDRYKDVGDRRWNTNWSGERGWRDDRARDGDQGDRWDGHRADGRDLFGRVRDQGDLRAIPGDEWQRRDQGGQWGHDQVIHRRAPWADGRDTLGRQRDHGDRHGGWDEGKRPDDPDRGWESGGNVFRPGWYNDDYNVKRGFGRASEKLSVPAFTAEESEDLGGSARDDGIEYLISWITARFLDLEVARIGKAFRGGRMDVYLDRLQLEEGQELNILASVGNKYDRGQRKPWEGSGTRAKRTNYAHVTDYLGDEDTDGENGDEDECIPEEVAEAWATWQSAKEKYRNQKAARGYQPETERPPRPAVSDGGCDHGDDRDHGREARLKAMKAKSFCSGCGRKGHWHKDSSCPLSRDDGGNKGGGAAKHVAMTSAELNGLQAYTDLLQDQGQRPELRKETEAYRFGTGKIHYSSFYVILNFELGDSVVQVRTSIIPGDIPLLLSRTVLGKLGMIYDVEGGTADFSKVGLKSYRLLTTPSGHPAIPITPAKTSAPHQCSRSRISDCSPRLLSQRPRYAQESRRKHQTPTACSRDDRYKKLVASLKEQTAEKEVHPLQFLLEPPGVAHQIGVAILGAAHFSKGPTTIVRWDLLVLGPTPASDCHQGVRRRRGVLADQLQEDALGDLAGVLDSQLVRLLAEVRKVHRELIFFMRTGKLGEEGAERLAKDMRADWDAEVIGEAVADAEIPDPDPVELDKENDGSEGDSEGEL